MTKVLTKRRGAAALLAVAATLAATACSSPAGSYGSSASGGSSTSSGSSNSGSSASSVSSGPVPVGDTKGAPVKIGVIASVNAAISYPDVVSAEQAAARALNKKGGINGHPIQIVYCNDNFNPNQAATCARNLVADKVVATAGDFNAVGQGTVLSTLSAAGIPSVAEYDGGPAATDSHSFLFDGSIALQEAGVIDYATQLGKHVAMAFVDTPTTTPYFALGKKMIPALGGKVTASVTFPQTGDVSAQASALVSSKPDVVAVAGPEANVGLLIKEMDQLGYKGKFVEDDGALDQTFLNSLGSAVANQLELVGQYPPLSESAKVPGLKQFIADMAAEKAAGDSNAPTSPMLVRDPPISAWLAVYAIAEIANKAKASDASGVYDALKSAKNVDMMGVIPPWTPESSTIKSLPRDSDPYTYAFAYNNGHPASAPGQPVNTGQLLNRFNYQN